MLELVPFHLPLHQRRYLLRLLLLLQALARLSKARLSPSHQQSSIKNLHNAHLYHTTPRHQPLRNPFSTARRHHPQLMVLTGPAYKQPWQPTMASNTRPHRKPQAPSHPLLLSICPIRCLEATHPHLPAPGCLQAVRLV